MPVSIRTFTLDVGLQARFDGLAATPESRTLLFALAAHANARPAITLDEWGLRPEDYQPLFDLIGVPHRVENPTPARYKALMHRHYRKPTAEITSRLNALLDEARRRNRAIAGPRRVSVSSVVNALLTLGLNTLERESRENDDRSKGSKKSILSKGGDAAQTSGKRLDRRPRPNAAPNAGDGAAGRAA